MKKTIAAFALALMFPAFAGAMTDETGNRSLNDPYTNSSGGLLYVFVTCFYDQTSSGVFGIQAFVDDERILETTTAVDPSAFSVYSLSFVVPDGSEYYVECDYTGGDEPAPTVSLNSWFEQTSESGGGSSLPFNDQEAQFAFGVLTFFTAFKAFAMALGRIVV